MHAAVGADGWANKLHAFHSDVLYIPAGGECTSFLLLLQQQKACAIVLDLCAGVGLVLLLVVQ
jgi:hypothetical protein